MAEAETASRPVRMRRIVRSAIRALTYVNCNGAGDSPQRSPAAFRPHRRRDILPGMSTRPRSQAGPPMTCEPTAGGRSRCGVGLSADPWSDHVPVPLANPPLKTNWSSPLAVPPSLNSLQQHKRRSPAIAQVVSGGLTCETIIHAARHRLSV
jgi:hypothetical protein